MGTVEKRDRHKKQRYVSPEKKLERELKNCMHCKFFWGHNNRCANGTCCKLSKKKVISKGYYRRLSVNASEKRKIINLFSLILACIVTVQLYQTEASCHQNCQ